MPVGVYLRTEKHLAILRKVQKKAWMVNTGSRRSEETKEKLRRAKDPYRGSKYTSKEKEKMNKAKRTLNNAVQNGKLKRGNCIICGCFGEGHHEDYDKPLGVIWLCRLHHEQYHRGSLKLPELLEAANENNP